MSWPQGAILLLEKLVDLAQRIMRRLDFRRRQEERDDVEEDPAAWYGEHFGGGVQRHDARETDKTDDHDPRD